MPIEVGIWKLGARPQRLPLMQMATEAKLEQSLRQDIDILRPQLLVLGWQVLTAFGKRIDILAMDPTGKLLVIELKRDRTPREVVAQLLDYGSWVKGLSYEDVSAIYTEYNPGKKIEEGFEEVFGEGGNPESVNDSHELLVVSTQLDPSTERIIGYLTESYGVPINAVFFQCYADGGSEYLARTWLLDPEEVEVKAAKTASRGTEPWNGKDFYVSLGEGPHRNWEDWVRYGFVSGGGGKWYSQTLGALSPGSRIFVNIPKSGYVGVGIVKDSVVPLKDFKVTLDGKEVPLLEAPLTAPMMGEYRDDAELSEYLVRVDWLHTSDKTDAYWEKGLFAKQHTACKLRNQFTIQKLVAHFGLED